MLFRSLKAVSLKTAPTVGRNCGRAFQGQGRARSLTSGSSSRVNLRSRPLDDPASRCREKLTVCGIGSIFPALCSVFRAGAAVGRSRGDVDLDNNLCYKMHVSVRFSARALKDLPDCGLDHDRQTAS